MIDRRYRFGSALFIGMAAPLAMAQEVEETLDVSPQEPPSRVQFSLSPSADFQFNDSDFDVFRYRVDMSARMQLRRETSLSLRFGYELSDYDLEEPVVFDDAWEEIHTTSFGAIISHRLDNDWSVFGGPIFQFALEDGADWGDSFAGGGIIGATWYARDGLTLGGGIGIVTQIEEEIRVFPVLTIDWEIANNLRLSSTGGVSAGGRGGVELIYDLGRDTEIAFGGAYDKRRFRLDDEGVAPDGVGEDRGIPLWLRLTHNFNESASVSLYGGYVVNGDITLEDKDGDTIAKEEYDPAPFIGLSATFRF